MPEQSSHQQRHVHWLPRWSTIEELDNADSPADSRVDRDRVRGQRAENGFLSYKWKRNEAARSWRESLRS
jgi:hypothetical protein